MQIIRNLWRFIIYKYNLICLSLSFTREIFKNISICRQAHYLTKKISLIGRPCVRILTFSAMSIRSIKHVIYAMLLFVCDRNCQNTCGKDSYCVSNNGNKSIVVYSYDIYVIIDIFKYIYEHFWYISEGFKRADEPHHKYMNIHFGFGQN